MGTLKGREGTDQGVGRWSNVKYGRKKEKGKREMGGKQIAVKCLWTVDRCGKERILSNS